MSTDIPRDVLEFLQGYPNESSNDSSLTANLLFYQNKARCRPDNLLIDTLHDRWLGDFETLEYKHGFIQWLFPIQEYGMNYESQPLQRHELDAMKSSPDVIRRIIASYRLMLDFYGMQLVDEETGRLARVVPPRNFEARYNNLVRSTHNNLRISRILKCLSEMGLERLNAGFLLHVLNEQSQYDELRSRMLISSMDRWWANCIRNEDERKWVGDVIRKVRTSKWVFTTEMYESALQSRQDGRGLQIAESTLEEGNEKD
ncbi:hypothetical protein CYLTODRAFT_389511 [Cylindrobasidium torrendii FP15055 ss-10]|uniref:Opioid growth factor receptor (OGFr) conserved domain-containing protein n=1 Tax=Cylindrobasidium torrendii FP15055 ss-10 TaxID=1314674 RepID=A0A0D7BP82_9AGAR|nr:hypothetical protein CYLTODRAFT_389511 [Cylindrobasidium torrendii FP15055 ss-10]